MITKKTLIIGIDGNEANSPSKVGVHQYAYEMLHQFYRMNEYKGYLLKFIIFLQKLPCKDLPEENSSWRYEVLPGEGLWLLKKLTPHLLLRKDVDVFFSPNHYLPLAINHPLVCTIHDLGYLKFSEQFTKKDFWQLKYWSAISLFIAQKVIAVSQSTRSDIIRYYPFSANKLNVVYHGYDKSRFNLKIPKEAIVKVRKKYGITKNYILYLGTLKPSKNIEGLLESFSRLSEKYQDLQLVIAGKKGWLYSSIFSKVQDLRLEDSVIFTDYVDEADKPALLSGARLLASPSYWEGFGMQIIEALACGIPVVLSNVASLPEVAGKTGVYVEPGDPDSIFNGIQKVLKMDKNILNSLVKDGVKQAAKFSWEKSASETMTILINSVQ